MEPQTFDFKPDTSKLSKEMQTSLKAIRVSGTYRVTKK